MRRDSRAGISLLETMIALALMALLAAILSSGMGSAVRVLRRSESISAAAEQAKARRDLREWLEHTLTSTFPGYEDGVLFGKDDQLQYMFVSDGGEFWAGDPVVVTVSIDENRAAILTAQGAVEDSDKKVLRSQVLAGPMAALHISYFGRLQPDEPMAWLDQWPPSGGLPDLIRFSFSTPEANIPPLTVRPAKALVHSEMSLSSLLPPSLPSRP